MMATPPKGNATELLPKSVFRRNGAIYYVSRDNVTKKYRWHRLGSNWNAKAQAAWKRLVLQHRRGAHASRLVYSIGDGPIPVEFLREQLTNAKKNAKARGLECAIEMAHLMDLAEKGQGRCSISGIPFEFGAAAEMYGSTSRRKRVWAPSIDRIDSSAGYVPGNIRLVCMAVNVARQEFGDEVLLKMARALSNIQ